MAEHHAKTERVFLRLTPGQMRALRSIGITLAAEKPTRSYRWLNSDGLVNVSAVVREELAKTIPGFEEM